MAAPAAARPARPARSVVVRVAAVRQHDEQPAEGEQDRQVLPPSRGVLQLHAPLEPEEGVRADEAHERQVLGGEDRPSPEPEVPHLVMKEPVFVNFWIRLLYVSAT